MIPSANMQMVWIRSIQLMAALMVFSVGVQATESLNEPRPECKFRLEKERKLFEELRLDGQLTVEQEQKQINLIRNAELVELGNCLRTRKWSGIREADLLEYEIFMERFYVSRGQQLATELQVYTDKRYEAARVFTERQLRDLQVARQETFSLVQAFRNWLMTQ